MGTKTSKSKKAPQKKRAYSRERIIEVLDSGGDWRLTVVIENDVMREVVDQKKKTGAGYDFIINNKLRQIFGIKK